MAVVFHLATQCFQGCFGQPAPLLQHLGCIWWLHVGNVSPVRMMFVFHVMGGMIFGDFIIDLSAQDDFFHQLLGALSFSVWCNPVIFTLE